MSIKSKEYSDKIDKKFLKEELIRLENESWRICTYENIFTISN